MAHLYDEFYKNKDYIKEVEFIRNFTKDKTAKILDAGCGTGNHAKILNDLGFDVLGFDKSQEIVNIANSKINGKFFVLDLLNFKTDNKFNVIISFFAVFNHLRNYKEVKKALNNLKNALASGGTIIIDLHNPQNSGKKIDNFNNITRVMKWRKCSFLKKEFTKIYYDFEGKMYKTGHIFAIFNIKKLENIANDLGFTKVDFYENYDLTKQATKASKNIQMVLSL